MGEIGQRVGAMFSNDSPFGRLMNKCGIIIAANIMFIAFCIPIVTAGASYTALHYVCLKTIKNEWEINPFKEFWIGFKTNLKQGIIAGIISIILGIFLIMDIKICTFADGLVGAFKIPVYALSIIFAAIVLYLFPTMATFENKLKKLAFNGIFFAIKKPVKTLVILFINIVPLVISYIDVNYQPLYAFIWFFFGFGLITMIEAWLLWPEFKPFIEKNNDK